MKTMTVTVSGMDLNDVLRRCKEKEEADYECIKPIERVYDTAKSFSYQSGSKSRYDKYHFKQFEDLVRYRAVYRKVEA